MQDSDNKSQRKIIPITGFGILLLKVLSFPQIYFFWPVVGTALNKTSSVLYGTVGNFVSPRRIARAHGIFYTLGIAASALAPPIMGRLSDILGLDDSIRMMGWIASGTVPMAFVLAQPTVKLKKEN